MITVYECTDCEHCISFGWGFRIACGHKDLPANEVYKYAPLDEHESADDCAQYTDGFPKEFQESEINKAVEMFGDDVSSLRKYHEWRKNEKNKIA